MGHVCYKHSTRLRAFPTAGVTAGIAAYLLSLLHPPAATWRRYQQWRTTRREETWHVISTSSHRRCFLPRSTTRMLEERSRRELYVQKLTSLFFFFFLSFRGRSHSAATAIQAPDWPQQSSVFGNLDCFLSCLGALRKGCWRGRERKACVGVDQMEG